ncbi:hypothetical protein [Flavobacterium davisii]|uniref:Uncharacterized protein n=1 Tax=Flavobacterium columnare TaxID=996 RepID=A0A8G0KS26_9FLAO|nr:hypothetical protein [Flavobacterium davisii]QYS87943.1 hypothetical protein JJC05_08485 [Flavobacterium davisii]
MTVTLDPIPPDPTISVSAPAFNCNGSATSTVTVNNGSTAYTYTYSISPALNPPHDPNSNIFKNVQCGNSTITVNYNLTNPPTFSNLLKEDFGSGPDVSSLVLILHSVGSVKLKQQNVMVINFLATVNIQLHSFYLIILILVGLFL